MRAKCKLGPFDRLDPFELADKMNVNVIGPYAIADFDPLTLGHLLNQGSRSWSAGTLKLPNGEHIVVMNPTHDPRRQLPTLMEELVHIELGHNPSELRPDGSIMVRTFDKTAEQQAYFVGAAALLPGRVLKGARTRGMTVEELANERAVSRELVKFRLNLTGIKLL